MIAKNIRVGNIEDGHAIGDAAGVSFNPVTDIVISRLDRAGELMGGAIFKEYTGIGGSIAVHFAGLSPRWISRDLLFVCFDYPFNQLGVKSMFAQVPASNLKSLRVCEHIGWRHEYTVKDVYPDGDMHLLRMYKHECKHLDLVPSFAKEAPDGR